MFNQPSLFGPRVLSVSDLSQYLRALLESDEILQDVWVSGEISTLSTPSSGHIYFTLKDGGAVLRCVIWRMQAARMRIALQTGMQIEAHGHISLYEASGQYQLYVDTVRQAGEGLLFQEYLRLKAQLEAEGLFDQDRKRPIPTFPHRIGIVTSPTGAALQDMINTLSNRFPLAEVVLAPAIVQGDEAPPTIVSAIKALNASGNVDVILLARGGGSMEDLWAFNDEEVVRAVAESKVPVVTGVGHETDFTLVDYASDLRAPTPTGAAVLATPDKTDLLHGLAAEASALDGVFADQVRTKSQLLAEQASRLKLTSPQYQIQNDIQRLDDYQLRLHRTVQHQQVLRTSRLESLQKHLNSLNPLQILRRGYAVVRDKDGKVIRSVQKLQPADALNVRVTDGTMDVVVQEIKPD